MDIFVHPPYSKGIPRNGIFTFTRIIEDDNPDVFEDLRDLIVFERQTNKCRCQMCNQFNVYFNNHRKPHYRVQQSRWSDLFDGYWLVASINQLFSFWKLRHEIKNGDGEVIFRIEEDISNNELRILVRGTEMLDVASIYVTDKGTEKQRLHLTLIADIQPWDRMIIFILAGLMFLRYYNSSISIYTRKVTTIVCILLIAISFVLMSSFVWLPR